MIDRARPEPTTWCHKAGARRYSTREAAWAGLGWQQGRTIVTCRHCRGYHVKVTSS